jgi:hypothetical protein
MLTLAAACGIFGPPDLSRVQELEVTAPDSLEEYDTLVPHAQLLDGHGDSVPGAVFVWATLDTAILTVLDATTGKTVVNHPSGTGRLLVRTATLVHDPVAIVALAAADTLFAVNATADTVTLPDSLSDSLKVKIADTIASASGGDSLTVPLPHRPIEFAITYPAPPVSVRLVVNDTHLSTDTTVATGSAGVAAVKVRLIGPNPDSVVVTARARRAVGTTVPGSPVTFVVRFQP